MDCSQVWEIRPLSCIEIVWFLVGKLSSGVIDPRLISALFGVLSILWLSISTRK